MKDYRITTDSAADLPVSFYEDNNIRVMELSYIMGDTTYSDLSGLSCAQFYDKVRNGAMPTTSQVNPEQAYATFEEVIKTGVTEILHIGFSSGLSGSYNSARIAAEQIMEEKSDVHIIVIDSLCASLGEGLLVYKVNELHKAGKSMEETAKWAEENKLHVCHNFTVDDLNHLHRGGRISKATAVIGTVVNIKPILHVDDAGHLINIGKTRGRKKSLSELVKRMETQVQGYENDIVMISHGDCLDDAKYVQALIEKKFGIKKFLINPVGAVIGTHSGPGTLALFFMGAPR